MKKINRILSSGLVLFAVGLHAVDLKNEDSKSYEIVIESGMSTTTTIGCSTTISGICSSCKIIVKGAGSVNTSVSSVALINDGRGRS